MTDTSQPMPAAPLPAAPLPAAPLPAAPMLRVSAQVAPYVEVLRAELTVTFLLTFGGAGLYLAVDPKGRSEVETLIGAQRLAALARAPKSTMQMRVPLAKKWLAEMLQWQGYSRASIARTLRVSDVTVARYLNGAQTGQPKAGRFGGDHG